MDRLPVVMKKSAIHPTTTRQTPQRRDLCGKTQNLTKPGCCDEWICDDTLNFVVISISRNCCYPHTLQR